MKKWFAAALLVLAVAYTAYGLATLTLVTSTGRPAAGFFPLLIGLLLTVSCAVNLWSDVREWQAGRGAGGRQPDVRQPEPAAEETAHAMGIETEQIDGGRQFAWDVSIAFVYLCGFVGLLQLVGALIAMILFMLVFLFTFNGTKPISNIVYSLALPGFLYWLFKIMLNASLPLGPLGL